MTLRKACSKCQDIRWCNEGKGFHVGEHHCKNPYSICRDEDKEAAI